MLQSAHGGLILVTGPKFVFQFAQDLEFLLFRQEAIHNENTRVDAEPRRDRTLRTDSDGQDKIDSLPAARTYNSGLRSIPAD